MKRMISVVAGSALVIVAGLAAVAQSDLIAGLTGPVIINLQQSVPITVDLALPQADGSVITATAPLTVGIGLQITIDGQHIASVAIAEPAAPVVAVAAPTPTPAAETPLSAYTIGDNVTVGEVRWIILSAVDEGQTITSNSQFVDDLTTPGKFIRLTFEMENLSKDMITYGGIELVDNQDRTFKPSTDAYGHIADNIRCQFIENLNPNLPKQCQLIFEVPTSAEGLHVKVGDLNMFDAEEQVINLGL